MPADMGWLKKISLLSKLLEKTGPLGQRPVRSWPDMLVEDLSLV